MDAHPRQLHRLEKIVALFAVFAVLALTVGFAQGAGPAKKKAKAVQKATQVDEFDRVQAANPDQIFLRSSSALVQDATSGETIFAKNAEAVLPIASITKLMTAMVVLDRDLGLEDRVVISSDDMDTLKGTHSRLRPGAMLSRNELLLLALMASENRAAAALARTYPGGTQAFVTAMNDKAHALGMQHSRFADSTGLTPGNVSTAPDLARLVRAAHEYPVIRQFSTRDQAQVEVFGQPLQYHNTNGLVRGQAWDIGLSKTGYISEAGRCLVMRVRLASKDLVVILLDSWGKNSRIGDAQRIKKWLETSAPPRRDRS
jgi:D-alanyl-D-alanine endopeptidase (penicillin-binding protein 7)